MIPSHPIEKANVSKLQPENQFPAEAIDHSKQVQPDVNMSPWQGGAISFLFSIATSADMFTPWGKDTRARDKELRQFWPTEPYLAGGVVNVSMRNAAYDWEIQGASNVLTQAVTDMLERAIAGDKIGWNEFMKKVSQDMYTTDNGAFIELIRDEGMDANSKFKGAMAPVVGISHLDSNQCVRTGNAEIPVIYIDREERLHKMQWYNVLTLADFPSPIEKMNGVGYCAVTRLLRLAQIMKSNEILQDEMMSGRNSKDINVVSGVSRTDIDDAVKRTKENANNMGNVRYIDNVVLASLDPEKPVSVATIHLAGFPEGFDYGKYMEWFMSGMALNFGTDYQEFAPLPGGNIGSGSQSEILSKKSSGKGPRNFMDTVSKGFKNYGVLPRGCKMIFDDKNQQEEAEKQMIRTQAMEEAAMAVNSKILTPEAALKSLVRRGIYDEEDMQNIPADWWASALEQAKNEAKGQPVGDRSGNTIGEDAKRSKTGNSGGRLRKIFSWPGSE